VGADVRGSRAAEERIETLEDRDILCQTNSLLAAHQGRGPFGSTFYDCSEMAMSNHPWPVQSVVPIVVIQRD
jgi:hypothetical protein